MFKRINDYLGKIETGLLCFVIAMMIGLAILKIVFRYVFQMSFLWSDMILQHLTLWLCFLGAARASCEKRHISIDVLSRFLPANFIRWSVLIVESLSLIVVGILAYYGFVFIKAERLSPAYLIGSIPLWWAKAIIPLGFVLIGIHLLLHLCLWFTGDADASEKEVPPVLENTTDEKSRELQ